MTIATQNQEGEIKALLNSIQKKRKKQGERINNQADILLLALEHYSKIVDLGVTVEESIKRIK